MLKKRAHLTITMEYEGSGESIKSLLAAMEEKAAQATNYAHLEGVDIKNMTINMSWAHAPKEVISLAELLNTDNKHIKPDNLLCLFAMRFEEQPEPHIAMAQLRQMIGGLEKFELLGEGITLEKISEALYVPTSSGGLREYKTRGKNLAVARLVEQQKTESSNHSDSK